MVSSTPTAQTTQCCRSSETNAFCANAAGPAPPFHKAAVHYGDSQVLLQSVSCSAASSRSATSFAKTYSCLMLDAHGPHRDAQHRRLLWLRHCLSLHSLPFTAFHRGTAD